VKWRRNLVFSFHALNRARTRTLLSASSMTIGVAAMFALLSLAAGAEEALERSLETMGRNLLAVGAQRRESDALRGQGQRFQTLTMEDWEAIEREIEGVERAAPIAMNNFDLRYAGESMNATVIGTTPEFQFSNVQHPSAGRFIGEFDLQNQARVEVIGSQLMKELFLGEEPLGERLIIGGSPFEVIGVLQEKGADPGGSPQDDKVLVPITTAMRRLLNVDYVDRIFVQARAKDDVGYVLEDVRDLLRQRHHLSDAGQADDFTITDQANLVRTISRSDEAMARLLGGLSAILLGLASIGLLAVSLLSVRERHAEIGLRLAVGASPWHVMMQFLAEAVMIALLGAASGLFVGSIGISLGEWMMGWHMEISGLNALYTMLIPLGLSVLAGAYPALRAARLDPLQALRAA